MTGPDVTTSTRLRVIVILAIAALCTTFASEAKASCFANGVKNPLSATPQRLNAFAAPAAASQREQSESSDSIVGMWLTEYLIGDGPVLFDQAFQQFHSGGTEMMLSNAVPPALGNVCLGVWKAVGPRAVQLRHLAWNWDADGRLLGTFVLLATIDLERGGGQYSGTWTADSYDPSGTLLPELHAEGIVRASRITAD
jgi:hypothetical protein